MTRAADSAKANPGFTLVAEERIGATVCCAYVCPVYPIGDIGETVGVASSGAMVAVPVGVAATTAIVGC